MTTAEKIASDVVDNLEAAGYLADDISDEDRDETEDIWVKIANGFVDVLG